MITLQVGPTINYYKLVFNLFSFVIVYITIDPLWTTCLNQVGSNHDLFQHFSLDPVWNFAATLLKRRIHPVTSYFHKKSFELMKSQLRVLSLERILNQLQQNNRVKVYELMFIWNTHTLHFIWLRKKKA